MNVQWTQFPNLEAKNKPRKVDIKINPSNLTLEINVQLGNREKSQADWYRQHTLAQSYVSQKSSWEKSSNN